MDEVTPIPSARRQLALLLGALVLFAAALALATVRYRGPAPVGEDAPPQVFSAARARVQLERVVGDGAPRPVGSAAAARAREVVLAELAALGLEPEVQEALSYGAGPVLCAVRNVLARVPGREGGPAVLLACHYDSERCSPGAGDDGAAVAAMLEIARALARGPRLRRDVVLLFDEGEESGLLGARAFAREHPWAEDVFAVVNLEARGTRGASIFFESSEDNGWLAELFAQHVAYPVASSLAHRVYRAMPNDTDLTVFKQHGMAGVNFAFIGGNEDYHTTGDSLAALSLRSLQHHGDNALAMTRALAELDGPPEEPADAVFFDVLAWRTVRWPAGASGALALLSAVLLAVAITVALRRRALRGRDIALGLVAALLTAAAAVSGGLVAGKLMGAAGRGWPASPWAAWMALGSAALCGASLASLLAQRLTTPWGLWAGGWSLWCLCALVAAVAVPGACYPLLVPALVAGPAGLLGLALAGGARRHPGALAVLLPVAAAAVLWAPLLLLLHAALGLLHPLVAAKPVAFLAWTAAAALAPGRGRLALAAPAAFLALSLVGVVAARALPFHTEEHPQRFWLALHHDADGDEAEWLCSARGSELSELHARHAFERAARATYPWSRRGEHAWHAAAPALDLEAPEVELLGTEPGAIRDGAGRRVRLRLRSRRGASVVGLGFGPDGSGRVEALDGVAPERGFGPSAMHLTSPAEGFEAVVTVGGDEPVALFVWDATQGLPFVAQPLLGAVPLTARESWNGHRTVVSRAIDL